MNITTEPLENRQLRLTIELDDEQTQQAMRKAARKISKQANIPGFRKGKAPYELVLQRYGEETIRQEAADDMVAQVFAQAMVEQEIEPYAPALLENTTLDPITFEFLISLFPSVDLGDYRAYRLKYPKVRVYKKDIQRALEEIREQNAILEPAERPVALGDGAIVDIEGWAGDNQVVGANDMRIILNAASTDPAPGFAQAIVGMEPGEERTFTLPLPDDFPHEDLRGRETRFTVKLKEVYDSTLPDLDDDLARATGNFDSLKELEAYIKERLREKAQQEIDSQYTTQVTDTIVEQAQIEYPPDALAEALDDVLQEFEQEIKQKTRFSLEDYARLQGRTLEDIRDDLEPIARSRLERALVLGRVVELENLQVEDDEITEHIESISTRWGDKAADVRKSLGSKTGRAGVANYLLAQKAVQRLVAIAKGEAPELVIEETEKEEQGE